MHSIVLGGFHFSLLGVLEHLASIVFCDRLTPFLPDSGDERVCLRDNHSAEKPNWTYPFFDPTVDKADRCVLSEFNVWYLDDATFGDSPERVHADLVVLLERRLVRRSTRENVSSLFSIIARRRPYSKSSFRGFGWLNLLTFHFWKTVVMLPCLITWDVRRPLIFLLLGEIWI